MIRTLYLPFLLMLLFCATEMLEIRLFSANGTEAFPEVLHLSVPLKRISLSVRAVLIDLGSFPANWKLNPTRCLLFRLFHTTLPLLRNSFASTPAPRCPARALLFSTCAIWSRDTPLRARLLLSISVMLLFRTRVYPFL